jgi:3-hydroxyacyl-CoA dehydrogenase
MMDLFGLNLALDTWRYGERDVIQEALRPQVLALLQPYADRGEVGMKAGRGFYTYPEPAYQAPGFLEGGLNQGRIYSALAATLVTNALCIAAEDVADPEDIDRAWRAGMFLDAGPFVILEQIGRSDFLQALAVEEAAGRLLPEKANKARAYLGRDELGQMTENPHE